MRPREIGWSSKSNALYKVLKALTRLTSLACKVDIGSLLNPEPPIPALNTSVLYNWDAIVDVRDIAPTGFNIATEEDWADLLGYVGGMADGGAKLKALLNWTEPNTGATDEYQFEAYPGGTRNADGTFADADYKAYFWIKNTNE